ncbi:MAG TPA: hypothetical protein VGK78_11695 [Nocardioides sp.]|uniref:hypothetical protein n=1 Tax=Nocardioides sp. TaxID=35761 RepID=UPI002F426AF1
MARRVNLPAADDLFRPTDPAEPARRERTVRAVPTAQATAAADDDVRRRPSGRVRHDEKITIYVTADELLDLEHARLELRRHHGLAVDRGRLVREAVALVLADLDEHGHDSMLVQRLFEA